jgi:serine/threonine-protein kinase
MIGAGMLGRVYAARHKSGRTDVEAAYAIKVVRRKWWDSPEVMRIVRREAFVGCRVRHPNVVPVLDARLDSPPHFLVMPRLWGVTLEALVDRHPPMRPAQALRIARQIAEGLAAIDATCGMTHGDVKPHNVFISANGKVTLLDLGFAGRHHEHEAAEHRPLCGSLAYAAPETLLSTLAADVRSDVYSLGATLYEMLSGRRPHAAAQPGQLLELVRTERPVCLRKLRPELPRPIASLVHRMLSKDPLRRPQSYAELIGELERLEIACFAFR